MASDGHTQPAEDEMLPDERAIIAERAGDLDELDADEFLSTEDVAAAFGIDTD